MGRLFLIDLETRHRFVCNTCFKPTPPEVEPCETHIALFKQAYSWLMMGPVPAMAYLKDAVNVIVDEATKDKLIYSREGLVSNVYCVKCHDWLGCKYIQDVQEPELYDRNVFLLLRKNLEVLGVSEE